MDSVTVSQCTVRLFVSSRRSLNFHPSRVRVKPTGKSVFRGSLSRKPIEMLALCESFQAIVLSEKRDSMNREKVCLLSNIQVQGEEMGSWMNRGEAEINFDAVSTQNKTESYTNTGSQSDEAEGSDSDSDGSDQELNSNVVSSAKSRDGWKIRAQGYISSQFDKDNREPVEFEYSCTKGSGNLKTTKQGTLKCEIDGDEVEFDSLRWKSAETSQQTEL